MTGRWAAYPPRAADLLLQSVLTLKSGLWLSLVHPGSACLCCIPSPAASLTAAVGARMTSRRQTQTSEVGDEADALGVGQVHDVEQQVDIGEDGDHQLAVPRAPAPGAEAGALWGAVLTVEAEHRPDDSRTHIQQDGPKGVDNHRALEGKPEQSGLTCDAEGDHHHCHHKAKAVDSHTPLCRYVFAVLAVVHQRPKDDAGHKGLNDFQKPRDSGHVTGDLSRFCPGQEHLHGIHNEHEAGKDAGCYTKVSHLTADRVTAKLDKIEWVDHCCRDGHECGKHGKSSSEVSPGNAQAAVQMRELAGYDEDSDGKTEGPDKHAESAVCCTESPLMGNQAECGASKHYLQQTNYSHRGRYSSGVQIWPSCVLHHLSSPADSALKKTRAYFQAFAPLS